MSSFWDEKLNRLGEIHSQISEETSGVGVKYLFLFAKHLVVNGIMIALNATLNATMAALSTKLIVALINEKSLLWYARYWILFGTSLLKIWFPWLPIKYKTAKTRQKV